jgi:ubiquinone/menaquinone biosynthesis C-methylase UbiE
MHTAHSDTKRRITDRALRTLGPHFGKPRGIGGYTAGLIMARSNAAMTGRVIHHLDLHVDLDLLDIGCGPGTALLIAAQTVPTRSLTGVDPSTEMLHLTRLRARLARRHHQIRANRGSAESIPLDDTSIDLCWTINSLHHWPNPHDGLTEIARVLRPTGRLVIAERYGPPANRHRPPGANDTTIAEIIANATAAGLTHETTTVIQTDDDCAAVIDLRR